MKAFVSSLISGMEPQRQAARDAVETARLSPSMAEDFGARAATPQITCLQGVREADVVVLILGAHYGSEQLSGLSATHEEWNAAKDSRPVLVFVEEGVEREPRQIAFVGEVEMWASGRFRAGFRSPRELQIKIGQALNDWQRSIATGPIDEGELQARASAMLPSARASSGFSHGPVLTLAVSGGPKQRLIRPIEMENPALADALRKAALFDETRLFDGSKGVTSALSGSILTLAEERGGSVKLQEDGSLRIAAALSGLAPRRGSFAIIDEEVRELLTSGLAYAAWTLELIDPTERVTHVGVAVSLAGAEHMPWMTRAEAAASNGSYSMGVSSADKAPERIAVPRGALRLNRSDVVDDLLVSLRRQWPRAQATGF